MAHFHSPHPDSNPIMQAVYWISWVTMFVYSKAVGFVDRIGESLPDITIPEHNIHYIPELSELIPAMILAALCAIVSFITSKTIAWLWGKVFPTKPK